MQPSHKQCQRLHRPMRNRQHIYTTQRTMYLKVSLPLQKPDLNLLKVTKTTMPQPLPQTTTSKRNSILYQKEYTKYTIHIRQISRKCQNDRARRQSQKTSTKSSSNMQHVKRTMPSYRGSRTPTSRQNRQISQLQLLLQRTRQQNHENHRKLSSRHRKPTVSTKTT